MTTSPEPEDDLPTADAELPPEEADAEPEAEAPAADESRQQLEAELAKTKDQWLRAVAETDNLRKRAQRDLEETSKYAITAFARDMVSVLENLSRAAESIDQADKDGDLLKTITEGVNLTLQELFGIFEKYGIKRVEPLNQKFDHNLHQAVVQVERNDVAPGTVVQVVQSGYIIHDRLLRPAMVVVSKQPGDVAKKVDTTV